MKTTSLLVVFACGALVPVSPQGLSSQNVMFNIMHDFLSAVVGRTATPKGLRMAARLDRVQPAVGDDVPFPCDTAGTRSAVRPSSVHQLRPGDIDVIAAMGDSLTAGNGAAASNLFHVATENRGISWSIGGQDTWRQHLTLANILKEFNPNLMGFSYNDSYSHHRASQFNVAEAGSMSRDMPHMAKVLVKRIRADPRVDYKNDWKLVTLMIGGNDYCVDMCYSSDAKMRNSPEVHRKNLIAALDYLRDNLPRTLVNMVVSPNVKILREMKGTPPFCRVLRLAECPCLFGKVREAKYDFTTKIIRQWQQAEEEVTMDPRYQDKPDFAVVMQPFIVNLTFPTKETRLGQVTDFSYLSEDCFHFSHKGYARAANALWNNMMEPLGQKSMTWTKTFARFLCPTLERPYLFTYGNSGLDAGTPLAKLIT